MNKTGIETIIAVLSIAAIMATGPVSAYNVDDGVYPEVHCKHFFYGCPEGAPATI